MSALTRFLFPAPAPRTVGSIFRWWEGRRLAYNLVVGAAGTVSVVALNVAAMTFGESPQWPWEPILVFGLGANLYYFLGPVLESLALLVWDRSLLPVGPALYRMGLTFATGLALLPALVVPVVLVVRLVSLLLGAPT